MFAKTIIDSYSFLVMPLSTQSLYFHLSMRADDEGFVNNPKKIARMIGTNDDEIKVLLAKNFILGFESGIIVIKHWKLHNYIQKDRFKATVYTDEKALLGEKENNVYTMDTECIHYGDSGKVRLGKSKVSIDYIYIVEHLNKSASTKYKSTTTKTQNLIKARADEGFTLEDFITVIDKKAAEWKNSDMEKYLRPETLFGTKFESYLNAKIIKTTPKQSRSDKNEEFLDNYFDDDKAIACEVSA
jgi:uncharacterized phage protein (TIGR02220 family)